MLTWVFSIAPSTLDSLCCFSSAGKAHIQSRFQVSFFFFLSLYIKTQSSHSRCVCHISQDGFTCGRRWQARQILPGQLKVDGRATLEEGARKKFPALGGSALCPMVSLRLTDLRHTDTHTHTDRRAGTSSGPATYVCVCMCGNSRNTRSDALTNVVLLYGHLFFYFNTRLYLHLALISTKSA